MGRTYAPALGALAVVAWLTVAPPESAAQERALIAVTYDDLILRIDHTTGRGTQIGALPSPSGAMGISYYAGELYVLDQFNDRLVVFDPATAALKRVVSVVDRDGVFSEGDFEIRPGDGVGFYTESDRRFKTLDIVTGAASQVSSSAPFNIDGLAFGGDGVLYAYQTGGALFTADPATGAFTPKWNNGNLQGILAGLEFGPDGQLYAAVDATLYRIDRVTGAFTTVGPIGFEGVSGLTLATVPEPLAALPAALLLLLTRRPPRRGRAGD